MVPVLMYHGLHREATDPGRFNPIYSVRPADFVAQLDWLVRAGFEIVRLADMNGPGKRVVITFDDGDVSTVEVALPLLVERGLVAEFFVVSDYIGRPGMVKVDDGRRFVEAGMGIQSHGQTHQPLEDMSMAELEAELTVSRSVLESWSGSRVEGLSLPGGRGRERERVTARRLGYSYILGSVPGRNKRWKPGTYLERIAVTRKMSPRDVTKLVHWTGLEPRLARTRYQAFEGAKRLLGNSRYARTRAALMSARGMPLPSEKRGS
jgi:peptidoglycan/xylan/chitin deacetylase (PgdA/CDA1 family)